MPRFIADLHVHSCLSPCTDIDVSPRTLATRARDLGIHLLALTDHNACKNLPAFEECCLEFGLVPVFGMELTTTEEVDVLCLFETLDRAMDFEALVHRDFPRFPLDEKFWNPQYVVNSQEEILDELDFLLTTASRLDLSTALTEVHRRSGLCIPAHIDRSHNSLHSQLGFLPPDPFDAVEITLKPEQSKELIDPGTLPLVADSDCHVLEDLGQRHTIFEAEEPGFEGYRRALGNLAVKPCWGFPREQGL